MDDYARLRKNEYLLAISGAGVIAFGLWSVIKGVIYLIVLSPKELASNMSNEVAGMEQVGISESSAGIILMFSIVFSLLVDLLLRFYVGRSAIIDGRRQKKKSIVYIVMAIMLSIGLISSIFARFTPSQSAAASEWSTIMGSVDASIFIDLTSLFAFIEMIIAGITVRRLRKKLGKTETEVM